MESKAEIQPENSHGHHELFFSALSGLVDFFSRQGLALNVSSAHSQKRLYDLPERMIRQMTSDLVTWKESLTIASASGASLSNLHNAGLRSFLKLMRISIPADFFDIIANDDIVEIYTVDPDTGQLKQVWRNWIFMSMCSYDLITLMTKPMHELFDRDSDIDDRIAAHALALIDNPVTMLCQIPSHIITEKLDNANKQFLITNRYCAPVFSEDNKVIGLIATLRAKPLGSVYANLPNVEPLNL